MRVRKVGAKFNAAAEYGGSCTDKQNDANRLNVNGFRFQRTQIEEQKLKKHENTPSKMTACLGV